MTCLAAGILLYRRAPEGPRLLLLRNAHSGQWGFPKGRRDPGDTHEVANAAREIEEETGYADLALDPAFRREIDYLVRAPDGGYDKRVVYFLAEAPGREPRLSPEHSEALWATPAQAADLLRFGQQQDLARAAFEAARARG